MAAYTLLDLSEVPVPDIIQSETFDKKYQQLKAILLDRNPDYREVLDLESEPLAVALQTFAYRELILEARINDATRANMLASAIGQDLDAIAARYNVARLTVQPADEQAQPPVAAIMEDDAALRRRVQMAFDGLNTAGSDDAYVFHALSASGRLRDADAFSPAPCEMVVTLLAEDNDGTPDEALLRAVRQVFGLANDGSESLQMPSAVRPLGDRVTVQAAHIKHYRVEAELTILSGPAADVIKSQAEQAVAKYNDERRRLGYDVTLSGLYAALHQSGVQNVHLIAPTQDLLLAHDEAPYCEDITVRIGGMNE